MKGFKARRLKQGWFEILGLEEFIEARLAELKRALARTPAMKASRKKTLARPADPFQNLLAAMETHPKRAELIQAGKAKDQLLRSLVPLYLTHNRNLEVTSGMISRFWKRYGVSFAAPNAAKALREHVGFARATKLGRQITPNGIKYVEQVLARRAA